MTATPGQLTQCVANLFGMSAATLAPIDRALVDAGLRRTGGRGLNAVKMNSEDAVSTLIAAAVQGTIRTAPDRVRTYGNLPRNVSGFDNDNCELPMPNLMALPDAHTFRDALSAIIQDYAEVNDMRSLGWLASVRFTAPWAAAVIDFRGEYDEHLTYVYMKTETDDGDASETGINGEGQALDLTAEYRFTCDTLIAVANLIGGGTS